MNSSHRLKSFWKKLTGSSIIQSLKDRWRKFPYIETRIIYVKDGEELIKEKCEICLKVLLIDTPQTRTIGPRGGSLAVSHPDGWLRLVNGDEHGDVKTHLLRLEKSGEKVILIARKDFELLEEK